MPSQQPSLLFTIGSSDKSVPPCHVFQSGLCGAAIKYLSPILTTGIFNNLRLNKLIFKLCRFTIRSYKKRPSPVSTSTHSVSLLHSSLSLKILTFFLLLISIHTKSIVSVQERCYIHFETFILFSFPVKQPKKTLLDIHSLPLLLFLHKQLFLSSSLR